MNLQAEVKALRLGNWNLLAPGETVKESCLWYLYLCEQGYPRDVESEKGCLWALRQPATVLAKLEESWGSIVQGGGSDPREYHRLLMVQVWRHAQEMVRKAG